MESDPHPPLAMVDTHAHLDDERFAHDLAEVLARAAESGVRFIVTIGTDLHSSREAIRLASEHPSVRAAVGIHPHDAALATPSALRELRSLACAPNVVAVGETGLDYYRDLSPRDAQMVAFRGQIEIALELDLPLVLHNREATADCLQILESYGGRGLRGVAHCFSGDLSAAERLCALGFYISFAGPVTFPNARKTQEVARAVPLERLLIETDCPYLAPQPVRGRRNEPAFVRYNLYALAGLRRLPSDELASITTQNALQLFRLPRSSEG